MAEEETDSSTTVTPDLTEVYETFRKEVGHYPHSIQQLFAYCKQKNYPYKFVDCNKFWPRRPNPETKPQNKAINADEYKDPQQNDSNKDNENKPNDKSNEKANDNADTGGDANADANADADDANANDENEEDANQ